MSKVVSGFVGAVAMLASLGAAQFAVGHDLTDTRANLAAASQANHVNRSAKADREFRVAFAIGKTIPTQVDASNDTSVAPRIAPRRDSMVSGKMARRPVACEAPASVLTEVAKMMESGRCVT